MGYQLCKYTVEEALPKMNEFTYALLYCYSGITLKKVAELGEVDWSTCTEGRFFDEQKEMHIMFGEYAVMVTDEGEDDGLTREYELAKHYASIGRRIMVKQYLDQDEDGQIFVKVTRLSGIA